MADAKSNVKRTPTSKTSEAMNEKLQAEGRKDSTYSVPPTPIDGPSDADAQFPARQGNLQPEPAYNDAPPSYEDAIASSLPPVDARRPEYAPPPASEDEVLMGDEKKRRDS